MLKYIFVILLSMGVVIAIACEINLDNIPFEIIATFLSITTGFTITALSIIATSSFSKNLYKMEKKDDNSQSLLHVLISKFKSSTFLFVLTIGLIIFHGFFDEKFIGPIFRIYGNSFSVIELIRAAILYTTLLSFISFVILFKTFAKFVTKAGAQS